LPVLQRDHHGLETRRNRAARLQDRFDEVDTREAAAHPRQLGADSLALIAETVALEALRLFDVEEYLAAALGVAGTNERCLGELFMYDAEGFAAETQMELGRHAG